MARAEVRGALSLDHERGEGLLSGTNASGLRVLCQRVRGVLPVPAVHLVLLKVPYAKQGVVLLLWARPVPRALLTPGAVGGHRFRSWAVGGSAALVVMLQLLLAVSARFLICNTEITERCEQRVALLSHFIHRHCKKHTNNTHTPIHTHILWQQGGSLKFSQSNLHILHHLLSH